MKDMKHIYSGLGVLALICLLLLPLTGCDKEKSDVQPEANGNSKKIIKVAVLKVEPKPMKDVLILPGETKPWQDITLASDLDGLVEWIGFEEGDKVKKGDLLAKIDASALKAAWDNAKANHELAEGAYKRRKHLHERNIIGQEELDQSRNQLAVAEGSLRQVKVQYEKGFVHSPIDGVINYLHVDPGEYVGRGGPVVELVNVDKVEISVNVPELDVNYFKPGGPAMFRVDAIPNRDFGGIIDFVALKADPATKTFRVKVLMDNADGKVRPGMIARVAFLRRIIPDALAVPLFAVVDRGGERLVYVEKDSVAQARTIGIGVITGDSVQITQGLEPGDHVIVTGQNDVQEGTKVLVQ